MAIGTLVSLALIPSLKATGEAGVWEFPLQQDG